MNRTSPLGKTLLALCFLALGLARAGAQTQIVGYNNNDQDLSDITDLTNSPYTTFIDGFLQPTSSSTTMNPNLEFDTQGVADSVNGLAANKVTAFNAVENAGKNVLLSFGGAGADSYYQNFATGDGGAYDTTKSVQNLANVLAAYVTGASSYTNAFTGASVPIKTYQGTTHFNGFSGIDLDFEDSQSFTSSQTYNGVQFVSQLTIDLRNQLGAHYLITQAPQPPYLDPAYTQNGGYFSANGGAYKAIFATGANAATSWLNVQMYNNNTPSPGDDGNNSVSGIVAAFEKLITANPNISASKFILTLPIGQNDASDNYFTSAQITQIVSQINSWLQDQGKGSLAGITGFQLYDPSLSQSALDARNLAFADAFLDGVPEPSTWAFAAGGLAVLGWTLRRRFAADR